MGKPPACFNPPSRLPWENHVIPEVPRKRAKSKKTNRDAERSCRLDLRLTVAEKNKLLRKAVASRRTVTSVIVELIEGMR